MVGYFSLKAHLEEGWCHKLIALTDVKFVLSSREHKNIHSSSIPLLLMLWHSRRNTLYLLSVVWLWVCILSTKRLLLDMNFAELWHHQNSFSDFKVLCLGVVSACIRKTGCKFSKCGADELFLYSWHFCIILCIMSYPLFH